MAPRAVVCLGQLSVVLGASFPGGDPFVSSLVLDAFLFAPHSFHWTCLPTLTLAVLAWRSSCLPSRCGPKVSPSLACQVSLGTYVRPSSSSRRHDGNQMAKMG